MPRQLPFKKYKKILALRCFSMVKEMLEYGYPLPMVADYIINQGEYQGTTKGGIVASLKNYRNDLLPGDIISKRVPHVIIEAKKRYDDKLEDLRRMDNQFEAMLYRFDAAHARERQLGITDTRVDVIQRGIADMIYKMHRMKLELGISGQQGSTGLTVTPERLEEIRLKFGDKAAKAMADPVSRARVISYLKAVQDAATYDEGFECGDSLPDRFDDNEYEDSKTIDIEKAPMDDSGEE